MDIPQIIHHIRSTGCDVGWMTTIARTGCSTTAYAVCQYTGELWCVVADDERFAWAELARSIAATQVEPVESISQE